MARRVWFDRRFELGLPPDAFPDVLERIRGTPPRLEERLGGIAPELLGRAHRGSWSMKTNLGHLSDLEPLWAGRLDDLLEGMAVLREADLSNRATDEASHDDQPIAELLGAFRRHRGNLVQRLQRLTEPDLARTALHPRLRQPMTVTDLFFFVAEHDDHHLARITELERLLGG